MLILSNNLLHISDNYGNYLSLSGDIQKEFFWNSFWLNCFENNRIFKNNCVSVNSFLASVPIFYLLETSVFLVFSGGIEQKNC